MIKLSLVYFRTGPNGIERVAVVDGQTEIKTVSLTEALNFQADLAQIIAHQFQRTSDGHTNG